jgi:hypothetical protein
MVRIPSLDKGPHFSPVVLAPYDERLYVNLAKKIEASIFEDLYLDNQTESRHVARLVR